MTDIAIVYHEDFKQYDFGPGHPLRGSQCMDRELAFELVRKNEALKEQATISFAEPEEATEEDILSVHTKEYIDFVKGLSETGGPITLDTPVFKGMYPLAKLFAGADILGGKLVLDGVAQKSFVFGIMGHHVGADFGGGFGVINDVAIAVNYFRKHYGLKRTMVLDYAANAGHGTESIYYDTSEVLCVDIHQDPLNLYPGKGFSEQVGRGEGTGYTVNISLPPYSSDDHFLFAMNEIVVPITLEYQPDSIIAVGLNGCHFTVDINQLMLGLEGLREMVRILSTLSNELCDGRFVHIGGFSLDAKLLGPGFLATVAGALDVEVDLHEPYAIPGDIPDVNEDVEESLENTKIIQSKYWKSLQ